MTIANIHRNIMGTVSFDGQFHGMRKPQDFIVYPLPAGYERATIKIQSDTRIGLVNLETGEIMMSKPQASGAYNHHLATAKLLPAKLDGETLLILKAQILATASAKAGTNGVIHTDNSGAAAVFGGAL